MTYCINRTNLLKQAGRDLAAELLPRPFKLWHSSHDTGCQMTIQTDIPGKSPMTVWRGSIWYASCYEFNDRDDIPGLQPAFDFARDIIDRYFAELGAAVAKRDADRAIAKAIDAATAEARCKADQLDVIDAVRVAIAGNPAERPAGERT